MTPADVPDLTADAMKVRFKQRCVGLGNQRRNWQVRVHRALSWLKRAGGFSVDQPEAKFLFLWITLNSLYGRWEPEKNAPGLDAQAREAFVRRVCQWDGPMMLRVLQQSRGLVKKLLENPFLSADFWRQPNHPKAKGWATADANYLDKNLRAGDAGWVLNHVMQRLFVFRGQLVHGASSGGSRLNRGSMKYCLMTLELLVPLIIHLAIEHGCDDDWPELCYPPMQ
jgi:hypothetical protein